MNTKVLFPKQRRMSRNSLSLVCLCALAVQAPMAALSQTVYSPLYTFTTLAGYGGDGNGGIGGRHAGTPSADGLGSTAFFTSPNAVAKDNSGNLYVADTYAHTIRKMIPVGFCVYEDLSIRRESDKFPPNYPD